MKLGSRWPIPPVRVFRVFRGQFFSRCAADRGVAAGAEGRARERSSAVLVAPPGAGKTTVVPLALLDEPWTAGGKLIVLEPRRLAARAAAERMAATLGEAVGETVGYRVRLESRVSARTRIEVVTEGVFTRMILDDPGPATASPRVLFDEFHERSLDADLGLAFARDARRSCATGPAPARDVGDPRRGARSRGLLDDAPVHREPGPRLSGRDPLPRPRRALRLEDQARPRGPARAGRGDRRPAGLPAGPGRDPARGRAAGRAHPRPGRRDRAALRRARRRGAGPRHRARRRRAGARWCWPPRSPRPA